MGFVAMGPVNDLLDWSTERDGLYESNKTPAPGRVLYHLGRLLGKTWKWRGRMNDGGRGKRGREK